MAARTLIKNEALLGAAIATRRFDILRSLTHRSFTYLGQHKASHVALSRAEWLRMVEATQTITFVHTTNDVLIFDNSAIITVEALWIGQAPAAASQQKLVMSDFWLKRDGQWKLARRHASTQEVSHTGPVQVNPDSLMID